MANDYENGTKKTIDLTIKAEKISSDILKEALQEFMAGKAEKKGRMSYRQLKRSRTASSTALRSVRTISVISSKRRESTMLTLP